jgi:hypothetical protein
MLNYLVYALSKADEIDLEIPVYKSLTLQPRRKRFPTRRYFIKLEYFY